MPIQPIYEGRENLMIIEGKCKEGILFQNKTGHSYS
jgi:hypothetical protein